VGRDDPLTPNTLSTPIPPQRPTGVWVVIGHAVTRDSLRCAPPFPALPRKEEEEVVVVGLLEETPEEENPALIAFQKCRK